MTVRPHVSNYMPQPKYLAYRGDPIDRLPGGDDLLAELTEAIDKRLSVYGERHVHPKRGGCATCAAAAADTVVRYLEANTRVIHSETLGPEEHTRAQRAMKGIRYLGGRHHLRLKGELSADPAYATVEDLLLDIETVQRAVSELLDRDNERDAELRQYRAWREAVHDLANEVVEQFDRLDPDGGG
jgi:hypothetical protein